MSSRVVQREEPCIFDSFICGGNAGSRRTLERRRTRSKDCIRKALEIVRGFEVGGHDL